MPETTNGQLNDFDLSFKVFHELMAKKVSAILLVSSPYDAFIMEEDGRLAERIIHEYRGLNLSRPPMLTWVTAVDEAIELLTKKQFDLVITMPVLDDVDPCSVGNSIKKHFPGLPVFLMAHSTSRLLYDSTRSDHPQIDQFYVWRGNSDLLLAIVKSVEDRWNIDYDTKRALVRVIIMVEDSPEYRSTLLPLLYKEIVMQTQSVMEESLNDEHRILRMRARPKILVAGTYEEAEQLYRRYKPYLLSIISDVRFPKNGILDDNAGFSLLNMIKRESPDIPLLNFSSEESNREKAAAVPAVFLNKNSPSLLAEIRAFFENHLGFGAFVFRLPDGSEVARAANLRELEKCLAVVPEESIYCHAALNSFSSWLMARSEILLATRLKPVKVTDFTSMAEIRNYLVRCLKERRKGRQRGVIAEFASGNYDPDADFIKIGKGSLGGKARGLAFISTLLQKNRRLQEKYPDIDVHIPKTLVISTDGFDAFMQQNSIVGETLRKMEDMDIGTFFLSCRFPEQIETDLAQYLAHIDRPLAVRSSSLLEDAQFQPFAGIYKTFMLPNNHPDLSKRLKRLTDAIKLVYASTYMEAPRSYAKNSLHRTEEEKMAVIIQQVTGNRFDNFFYPHFSGVAQSYNFYPVAHMKPEHGIAHIAFGLGKTVVDGETALRFSPAYPQLLPQLSSVNDILKNSQRSYYALKMTDYPDDFGFGEVLGSDPTLARLDIENEKFSEAMPMLSSTYFPEDNRIRDIISPKGYPVLTFAGILKHNLFPLADILTEILAIGRQGMGCPVEIEFAVDLKKKNDKRASFDLLQIRPMVFRNANVDTRITGENIDAAFCYSTMAMGNGCSSNLTDIIFVRPDQFDISKSLEIAGEIGRLNQYLAAESRKYLLIGPGRWGSADRWLGVPVTWKDISEIGAIVETTVKGLSAEPSQGSHFFHNITSLGISYLTIQTNSTDFIKWDVLNALPVSRETKHLRHVKLARPITIMINGRESKASIQL